MSSPVIKFLRQFVLERTGVRIAEDRGYIFDTRLQPVIRALGIDTIGDLARRLREGDEASAVAVVDAMTTNETYFFRDGAPFDAFRAQILPELIAARQARRRLRIWSAACATGQEAYSLAILLDKARHSLMGWSARIVATDVSQAALKRAEEGVFSQFEVQRGLPVADLMAHFEKDGEKWRVTGAPAAMVTFRAHNLVHDAPLPGPFDVIFCRNVLIYFDFEQRAEVVQQLASVLAPDGYLVLGASEMLPGLDDVLSPVTGLRGAFRLTGLANRDIA